jgi:hypothetical protein
MSNVDVQSRRFPVEAIAPATYTGDITGDAVNVADFAGAMAVINPGTIASGTFTPKLQHSFDGVVWDDVPASEVIGAFVDLVSDTPQKVGLRITRRLLRIFVTTGGGPSGDLGAYVNHAKPGIVGFMDVSSGNTPVLQGPLSLQAPQRDLLTSTTRDVSGFKPDRIVMDGGPWSTTAVRRGDWVNFVGHPLERASFYLVCAFDETVVPGDTMIVAPPSIPFEVDPPLPVAVSGFQVYFDNTADLGVLGTGIAILEDNGQTDWELTGPETWSGLGVAAGDIIKFENAAGFSGTVDDTFWRVVQVRATDKSIQVIGQQSITALDSGTVDIRLIKQEIAGC